MDASKMSTPSSDSEDWTMLDSGVSQTQSQTSSPKITIEKSNENEQIEPKKDNEECQELTENREFLQMKPIRKRCTSFRSDQTDDGRESDEESIVVISESEDNHDRIENITCDCDSKRPCEAIPYETVATEKPDEIDASPAKAKPNVSPDANPRESPVEENEVVLIDQPQSPDLDTFTGLVEYVYYTHPFIASFCQFMVGGVIISFLFAIWAHWLLGFPDVTNNNMELVQDIYQLRQELVTLEKENHGLKLKNYALQSEMHAIKFQYESQIKAPQAPDQYPPSGSGKGKKVRTRFDKFDRQPVAAGGDEETIVNVHVSPLDEFEMEPEPIATKIPLPPIVDDSDIGIETVDYSNFEPINVVEVENRTEFEVKEETVKNNQELPKVIKEPEQKTNKTKPNKGKSPLKENREKSKQKKSEEKQKKKEEKNEKHSHEKSLEKEEKRHKKDKPESQERKREHEYMKRSHPNFDFDDDDDDEDDDDDDDDPFEFRNYREHSHSGEHKHDSKHKKHDKENHHKEKYYKENHHKENHHKENHHKEKHHKENHHKENNKKDGSGHWQEKHMKSRENARKSDENWLLERQFDRENSRPKQDNWYIERSFDREIMRGSEGSTEWRK